MFVTPLPLGAFLITDGPSCIVVRDEEGKRKLREALCKECADCYFRKFGDQTTIQKS